MKPTPILNGLYGPLIVLEPGQKFDPDGERIFLFSLGNYSPLGFMMLVNGQPVPDPLTLHTGKRYRFRLINITDEGVTNGPRSATTLGAFKQSPETFELHS